MIKEIVSDAKTIFGNEESVNYLIEKNDNVVSFMGRNATEWRKNRTQVVLDHDAIGVLFVIAHDYEITRSGECEFYFDPLNESLIRIKKTDEENMFMLECVILGDRTYHYNPHQAFTSSVHIGVSKQENIKSKPRG